MEARLKIVLAVATALDQWTTIQCPSFLILALSSDHISEKNVGLNYFLIIVFIAAVEAANVANYS